jgi:hypothetical protein
LLASWGMNTPLVRSIKFHADDFGHRPRCDIAQMRRREAFTFFEPQNNSGRPECIPSRKNWGFSFAEPFDAPSALAVDGHL